VKLGAFLLNEKTKISLGIINFVILVGFVVTASFTFATWKAQMEATDTRLETMIANEIDTRESADTALLKELDVIKPVVIDVQARLFGIEANLEWLVNESRGGQ